MLLLALLSLVAAGVAAAAEVVDVDALVLRSLQDSHKVSRRTFVP